jgi:hypothetical protein
MNRAQARFHSTYKINYLRMKGLFIAFIVLQIGLDLAHSVAFFPFMHYGMYSQVLPRQDSIEVFEVNVDGKRLRPEEFRIYQWDMVTVPLAAFEEQMRTHDYAFDKAKLQQGMKWAGLGKLYTALKPNLDNSGNFPVWYKSYLGRILGHNIDRLAVDKAWYRWSGGRMQVMGKTAFIHG